MSRQLNFSRTGIQPLRSHHSDATWREKVAESTRWTQKQLHSKCVVGNISRAKATLPQLFFAQETTNCIMSGRGKCISTHYEHCEFVDCVLCASEFRVIY